MVVDKKSVKFLQQQQKNQSFIKKEHNFDKKNKLLQEKKY